MDEQVFRTVFRVPCLHCKAECVLRPSGVRITAYSHGRAVLRFFCPSCYRENAQGLNPEAGEALMEHGMPMEFVDSPAELLEHPAPGTPPISATDVAVWADMSQEVWDRKVARELGFDVER